MPVILGHPVCGLVDESISFDVQINARRIKFVKSCINVLIITLFYTNCTRGLAKTNYRLYWNGANTFSIGGGCPPLNTPMPQGVGSGEGQCPLPIIFVWFFHVKMMHFGVFCVQFHRPRARMNKISNVLESSIALAAVAGRRLDRRSVVSLFSQISGSITATGLTVKL